MSVYRIYEEGVEIYRGWEESDTTPYDGKNVAKIADPTGATQKREITSIPSPFARIALVKTAFSEVNKMCSGKQGQALRDALSKKDTIFHKMVSDTLDIGEIFFNYDKYKGKVEIITWNPDNLSNMKNGSLGERSFAESLEVFWKDDAKNFNFDEVKNIYILNYPSGPRKMNVIGATSPATLFFCNANNLSYVGRDIVFSQGDIPFDSQYKALYGRDPDYVKYLSWLVKKSHGRFPEVEKYLDLTYQALENQDLKDAIRSLPEEPLPEYKEIVAKSETYQSDVEVLGMQLYQKGIKAVNKSDFFIKSTLQPQSTTMVLPIVAGRYSAWEYVDGKLGETFVAPYTSSQKVEKRVLPENNTPHPWLTISDFLEDNLLASPHELNDQLFYDAGYKNDKVSYLIPLKPLFFEHFTVEDLIDGNMLTFEERAGSCIKVVLRIPTSRGNIEYDRLYTPAPANIENNEGHIVGAEVMKLELFEVSVIPAVRMPENVHPYYTVTSASPFNNKVSLSFYSKGKFIQSVGQQRNTELKNDYKTVVHTIEGYLDAIQLTLNTGESGFAIPIFKKKSGNKKFSFAVDLGTSNTHIEYAVDGNSGSSKPFEYDADNNIVGLMFKQRKKIIGDKVFEDDIRLLRPVLECQTLPESISEQGLYHFPTRTVLSHGKSITWKENALEMSNVCLNFGKQALFKYDDYSTNIKWDTRGNATDKLRMFIKNVVLMLRNKVLVSEGDINKTELVWFYPTSMSQAQIGKLEELWREEFERFFGQEAKIRSLSESIAPIVYHKENEKLAKDIVTIDIGGGTTDMAFSGGTGESVDCISSFRFASNALYSDIFSDKTPNNGIVDHFVKYYFNEDNANVKEIRSQCESDSASMAATLFNYNEIKELKNNKVDDLGKMLRDHEDSRMFKLEFVIFYASIIYHAGKIIKAQGFSLPRHIAFSGNGSKSLQILVSTNERGRKTLETFTKEILEQATGMKYDSGKLEILGFAEKDSPKRATCKGGLYNEEKQQEDPRVVILDCTNNQIVKKGEAFPEVNDETVDKILKESRNFFNVLKKVNDKFSFEEYFEVASESWDILNSLVESDDMKTLIVKALEARSKESDKVSETFFFYPIAQVLQVYADKANESFNGDNE